VLASPPSTKDSVFLPAMSMEVALARRAAIVEFTRRIMVRDQDFGEIPGTSKPTLLKPGAEKLCNFFGLEPEFTPVVEDIDWTGAQHGGEVFCYARYRCRLCGRTGGRSGRGFLQFLGSQIPLSLGGAGPRAHRSHAPPQTRSAPHFVRVDLRSSAPKHGQYGKPAEHWQRFRDAFAPGPLGRGEIHPARKVGRLGIDVDTALLPHPQSGCADAVNTVQKMAQKRALVAATLIATSASEFFTQDLGTPMRATSEPFIRLVRGSRTSATASWSSFSRNRPSQRSPRGCHGRTSARCAGRSSKCGSKVGETRYLEELQLAGVQNPGQFQSASKALACYKRLALIAAQPEVA